MEKLLQQLYGSDVGKPGFLPYRVFSDGKGESYGLRTVEHWPGTRGQTAEQMPTHCKLWGFVGLTVEKYTLPISQQQVRLCWTGIDIDGEDNNHLSVEQIATKSHEVIGNKCIIRTSKSGKGVHVLMPWGETTPKPYVHAKMEAKHDAAIYVKRLLDVGVVPCVFGLVNMWLYSEGGQQRTIWPCTEQQSS